MFIRPVVNCLVYVKSAKHEDKYKGWKAGSWPEKNRADSQQRYTNVTNHIPFVVLAFSVIHMRLIFKQTKLKKQAKCSTLVNALTNLEKG